MPQKKFENKNKKNKNTLPSARLAALGKDSTFASANGQHSAKDDGGATGVG